MIIFKTKNNILKYDNRKFETFRDLYDFSVGNLGLNGSDVEDAVMNAHPTYEDPNGLQAIAQNMNQILQKYVEE